MNNFKRIIFYFSTAKTGGFTVPLFFGFSVTEQIIFAKRLSMLLRSGMPIVQALSMLGDDERGSGTMFVAQSLAHDVSTGLPLSKALQRFEKYVGFFFINIIRISELSGTLPENLDYISFELKKKHTLKKQVIGALIYPCIIILATIAITALLVLYIFPKIIPVFASLKVTLPLSTRMLMAFHTFLANYGFLLFLVLVACMFLGSLLLQYDRFRFYADAALLHIPIFGRLSQYYNLTTTCRTLGLLLKSDVRIVEAIDIASESVTNSVYRNALKDVATGVATGQLLSTQLKKYNALFPILLVQMINAGESTGTISSTLTYLSEMYEEEIQTWTKNLTTILEPLLMLTMGLLVGFIAVSIITPIYGITQNLHQ